MLDSGRRYRHRSLRWCTTIAGGEGALGVDVLVANAGGGRGRPMDTKASTLDPALLRLVVDMNLFGTVYTVNAVAPLMKEQRSGKIITVRSAAGTAPSADHGSSHSGAATAPNP